MAQTITSAAAGRVNRRFLFLALILAALSAVLAYVALSRSGGDGTTSAQDIPVVVARVPIPAGTTITADMVELRDIPETVVGDQPISTIDDAIGRVARYPVAPNEQMLRSKIVGGTAEAARNDVLSNVIESGQRGMAIRTEAVVGAGGLVLPGDRVDVFWMPEQVLEDHEGAMLLAENVEVLAVEQTIEDIAPSAPGLQTDGEAQAEDSQRVRGSEAEPLPEAATVTLMVTPEQARRIFCGEEAGVLRLTVRAFGDTTASGLPPATCVILADRNE